MDAKIPIQLAQGFLGDVGGVGDERSDYEYLLPKMDYAQRAVIDARPDLTLETAGTLATTTTVTAGGTDLMLGEKWALALAYHVTAQVLMEDNDDPTLRARSGDFLKLFEIAVGGVL